MTSTDDNRKSLLAAALPHVAFDGWSQAAIRAGANDLGLSEGEMLNAFPGGAQELIAFFSADVDRLMLEALEGLPLDEMKVRDKVAAGVRLRLQILEPHSEAVRRGLSFLALPLNAPLGLKLLYNTVDAIWYAAGDRSTDYNFYTKRTLLSGVYSSTLMFWLNDKSEGREASWAFLERRIDEVLKVGGMLGKNVGKLLNLPDELAKRAAGRSPLKRRPSTR